MFKYGLSIIFTIFFIIFSTKAGGGWTNAKGKGYFKLGQSFIIADRYFTPAGDLIDITTTSYFATSMYAEYGITDKIDLVAYIPFFTRATLNQLEDVSGNIITKGDEVNSFGDTDLTLKYGIIRDKPFVLSASLTLGIPLGNPGGGKTKTLQTGDGEFNQIISVDASRSFGKFYMSAMGGINNREKGFSDELRYGLEGGVGLGKFYGILRFYGIKPFKNGNDKFNPQKTGLFSNRLEYLSFSPEIIYQILDNFGISASVGGAFYGKRILGNPIYSAGLFFKL